MKTFVPFLLFTLISSYKYTVPTETKSTDASSNSDDDTKLSDPEAARDHPKSDRGSIHWTPELKSELIDLWEQSDPLREGCAERLYHLWSQKHKKYSNISPKILKKTAENVIRKWEGPFDELYYSKLGILSAKGKFPWTKELKNSVMECFVLSNRNETELKRLWDERHPKFTHLNPDFLKRAAKNFQFRAKQGESVRTHVVWNDERHTELMDIWEKVYNPSMNAPNRKMLFKEWKRRHPDLCNFTPKYLKLYANKIIKQDTAKRLEQGEKSEKLRHRVEYFRQFRNRISWTPKMISDLLECRLKHRASPKALQRCWQNLQPEYAHLDSAYLAKTARQFLWKKNRYSQKERNRDKQLEGSIDGNYKASSTETPELYQSNAIQHTSYAPQFVDSQYELGERFRRTSRSHESTRNQNTTHAPQFSNSQYESGESSRGALTPKQSSAGRQSSHVSHFGGSQHVHGESSSRTASLNHFIPTGTSSYPHHPEGSHQGHSADHDNRPALEPTNQDQHSLEYQGRKRHTTHREESQKSESPKDKKDLDLDLRLK